MRPSRPLRVSRIVRVYRSPVLRWGLFVGTVLMLVAAAVASGTLRTGATAAGTPFVAVDLGTLGGTYSSAVAVSNEGEVVGTSTVASGAMHAFSWTLTGGMIDLGTLGGASSAARAVNEAGDVVGESTTASGVTHAFLWTRADGMLDLGTLGGDSRATDVNDTDQVVGSSTLPCVGDSSVPDCGDSHAFLWTRADGIKDLGTLGGATSAAEALNDSGQVVGEGATATGRWDGFVWTTAGGMRDLGDAGNFTFARDVNAAGEIVGELYIGYHDWSGFVWTQSRGMVRIPNSHWANAVSDDGRVVGAGFGNPVLGRIHAFTWTERDGVVDLGTLGGPWGEATDVNSSGRVVGRSVTSSGLLHAFVWAQGVMHDLGTLGGNESDATAVNENGWIVGASSTAAGPTHAALWTDTWVPDAPTNVLAEAGDGQATVAFAAPAWDGGSAIRYYTATASPGGASASGTSSPITVYGLENGTSVTVTVTATNSAGTGPASAPSQAVVLEGPERVHPDPPAEQPRPPALDVPPHTGPRPPIPDLPPP